ncbi:Fc.00g049970.m01.CDS01 [Cosmosporella sp. VM-42]
MEDPWGSPWTADAPPKLDLPAPPPHAHVSTDYTHHSNGGSRNGGSSPQKISPGLTPWEDDDAWGGWNESGKETGLWGRSPGLKPVGSATSTRLPSPAPGAALEAWAGFGVETRRREDQNGDSGISLGERGRGERGRRESKLEETQMNTEDVWAMADPEPASGSGSISPPTSDDDAGSISPEDAPRMALAPGTRPEALRQSSKVLELVQMFDGIARSQSVSPSPIEPPKRAVSGTSLVEGSNETGSPESETKTDEESMGDFQDNLETGFETEDEVLPEDDSPEKVDESELEPIPAKILGEQATRSEELNPSASNGDDSWAQEGHLSPPIPFREATQELNEDPWTQAGHEEQLPPTAEADKEPDVEEDGTEAEHEPVMPLTSATDRGQHEEVAWTNAHRDREVMSPVLENTIQEVAPKEPIVIPRKGPKIPFPIDTSKLDDLFPSVDASFPDPEPIPDVIIDDTFASISERKAWYRTSRYGSIRKHNLGDDENYVRINWSNSQIREQGIGIVRRWMEEDSIGGRVVLGRRTGAAGSKIFNWDSSAPQVEISELFGRKSHSRHASTVSKDTTRTAASPTVAAFGWSSTSSPTITIPPPASDTSPNTEHGCGTKFPVQAVSSLQPVSRPVSIVQASPVSPLGQPPITAEADDANEAEEEVEDEDDDDWGEMVSSPAGDTNGVFPPLADIVDATMATNGTTIASPTLSVPAVKPASVEQNQEGWAGNDLFTTSAAPAPANNSSKQSNELDQWDFGRDNFLGGPSEPAPTAMHMPVPTPTPPPTIKQAEPFMVSKPITKPLSPITPPSPQAIITPSSPILLSGTKNIAKPLSPIPPVSPHVPPQTSTPPPLPKIDTSKDDEIVANILLDLPDLSYMLR